MSEVSHCVPEFSSVYELRDALESKGTRTKYNLYPREGTRTLADLEEMFALLARVEPEDLVLCSSGMSAIVNTLEACITEGCTVACAWQNYAQTTTFVSEHLPCRGVKVVWFDSGSTEDVEKMIRKHKPDVVFSETVSNGPDMPVLNAKFLVDICQQNGIQPRIILDNTLPLSTGYDLVDLLKDHHNVIAVESATKSYLFNTELAGLIYSKDSGFISKLREHRATKGFGPNVSAFDTLGSVVPGSTSEFDDRNKRIFRASRQLAAAIHQAIQGSSEFSVTHPALPNHPNFGLSERILQDGSTPVFYIQCSGGTDQFNLTDQLWQDPIVNEQCELGQSFGFDDTRILPNLSYPGVRIATGANTDVAKLAPSFIQVLE